MPKAMIINGRDNVAVVLEDVEAGATLSAAGGGRQERVTATQPIPFGHKVALVDIPEGAEVYKYGEVIGRASRDIKPGEHVHIHNIEGTRGRGDLETPTARGAH
ncbi:MAG: UxaA family hydrolase [Chloroflexi bacterium]|nr:UxaA family hydrolase [Chloroflexota bacterium]